MTDETKTPQVEAEAMLIPDTDIASNPDIELNDARTHRFDFAAERECSEQAEESGRVVRGQTKYARVIRAKTSQDE